MEDIPDLKPPGIAFPGAEARPESAYRTAHDLLERRAPSEALKVLEPALEQEPRNHGLRLLRAWAFLMRAQLQNALGRALERQSRLREALPHLRLAAAMSGDVEHELAVLRVERMVGDLDR
jgi:tetratricopeptide (TPR) repeat protein